MEDEVAYMKSLVKEKDEVIAKLREQVEMAPAVVADCLGPTPDPFPRHDRAPLL